MHIAKYSVGTGDRFNAQLAAVKNALGLAQASGYGDKMVPEMVDFIDGISQKD